jgi:hypothetical protein
MNQLIDMGVDGSASQLAMQASRKATAEDHAVLAVDGDCEVGPAAAKALIKGRVMVLGTHRGRRRRRRLRREAQLRNKSKIR